MRSSNSLCFPRCLLSSLSHSSHNTSGRHFRQRGWCSFYGCRRDAPLPGPFSLQPSAWQETMTLPQGSPGLGTRQLAGLWNLRNLEHEHYERAWGRDDLFEVLKTALLCLEFGKKPRVWHFCGFPACILAESSRAQTSPMNSGR